MTTRLLVILVGGAGLAGVAAGQNLAEDLRLDASARTSALADSGAGWEKGNFFITDGGPNRLSVYGFFQTRYNMNFRDEDSAGSQGDFTHGFQMRRTRVGAKGTIWDKNLSFNIIGEFSRTDGTFGLLDAVGMYKWDNGWAVRWGQYKTNHLREENISDTNILAVDRSIVNNFFTQARSQGVGVTYTQEQFRFFLDFTDGLGTLNTDFTSGTEADYAFTARGEFRWGDGDWKRFDESASWRGNKYGGMVGLGAHYQDGGETGGTADTSIAQVTADVSLEGDGWNAFAAGVWRNTDMGGGGSSTDDFGLIVQGGYLVTEQIEPFIRYDAVFADDANGDDFHTLTGGVNYYISPNSTAVRLSGDVQYFFDNEGASAIVSPTTGSNLLADTEDGQFAVRVQMQVMF